MRACLRLTCARPDLWVLECQHAHAAKESNLLETLGLQVVIAQGGSLTPALYLLHVFENSYPNPLTYSLGHG